jgi:hypothetical protein
MKRFEIKIKSHIDAPDYESIVFAETREEAIERFYQDLRGEYDRDFIIEAMEEINER